MFHEVIGAQQVMAMLDQPTTNMTWFAQLAQLLSATTVATLNLSIVRHLRVGDDVAVWVALETWHHHMQKRNFATDHEAQVWAGLACQETVGALQWRIFFWNLLSGARHGSARRKILAR